MPTSRIEAEMQMRIRIAGFVLCIVFLALAGRLWYVQIASGDNYRQESERNRKRLILTQAPRGQILDRFGRVLATTRPQIALVVNAKDVIKSPPVLDRLARILGTTREALQQQIQKEVKRHQATPYVPVKVAADVPIEIITQVKEQQLMLPGVELQVNPIRVYPEGLGCHLLGYLGEANENELADLESQGYRQGDYVGKAGIEKELNIPLRGVDGGQLVEVDASGRMTRYLDYQTPAAGDAVTLTIDRDVQRAAEEGLAGKVGSAVAVDPRNGEVLALAAGPTFDANAFARGIKPDEWQKINSDPAHPLQIRPIANKYPPGSTFKIVTATAGLECGAITDNTHAYCNGSYYLGRHRFGCWSRHNNVDLMKAIAQSCDVFFYGAGLRMGPDKLVAMARAYGLGTRTGIALSGEKRGNMPDPEKAREQKGVGWHSWQTIIMAIGQGAIETTPLQMCVVTAAAANWGTVYVPQFIKQMTGPDGKKLSSYSSLRTVKGPDGKPTDLKMPEEIRWATVVKSRVPAKPQNLAKARAGLRETVVSGTGRVVDLPSIAVAGKTGSAENPRGKAHAWFVCFAPYDKPTIAICIMVEHGAHGATAAAPVARKMLEAYFHLKTAGGMTVRGD